MARVGRRHPRPAPGDTAGPTRDDHGDRGDRGDRGRRPRSRRGLRARATLAAALLALVTTAALSTISYTLVRTYLVGQRDALVARQAYANARVVRDVLRSGDEDVSGLLSSLRSDAGAIDLIRYRDVWFGSTLGASADDLPASLRTVLENGGSARQRFDLHGVPHAAVAVNLPTVDAVYVEVVPLEILRRGLDALVLSLLVGSGITVGGAAALGYWASRQVLAPVAQVAGAAEALAHGGLDTRLPDEHDPDLQRLVRSFNDMADSIQTRIEREVRFASDVSHELRTPLTALAAAADVLDRRRDELSPPGRQALDIVTRQIERFTTMVLDLLEISRIDAGNADLNLEPTPLGRLVDRAVAASGCSGVVVDLDPAGSAVRVPVDRRRFERMIANLLDNARRYGGRSITVRSGQQPGAVQIHVDDDGPGIPPAERAVIFDRFTRGSTAAGTSGTGLGLALVHEHAKLQGGSVAVGDSPDGGARFTLTLPQEQP
jgi:signal transduction histidine kinase